MKEILIEQKFREQIPALSEEEYRQLEANIDRDGCLDPLRLWRGNILVDGHHRYDICQKLNKPFKTVELKDLEDERDVKLWIYNHQLGKRNLNTQMFAYMIGEKAKLVERKEGRPKKLQKDCSFVNPTLTTVGKEHGITYQSVANHVEFADALNAIEKKGGDVGKRAKQAILNGKLRMTKKAVKEIAKQDANTIEVVMESRLSGEKDDREIEELKEEIAEAQDSDKVQAKRNRRILKSSKGLKIKDRIADLSNQFKKLTNFILKFRGDEPVEDVLDTWNEKQARWLYQETQDFIQETRSWQRALEKRFPELRKEGEKIYSIR